MVCRSAYSKLKIKFGLNIKKQQEIKLAFLLLFMFLKFLFIYIASNIICALHLKFGVYYLQAAHISRISRIALDKNLSGGGI